MLSSGGCMCNNLSRVWLGLSASGWANNTSVRLGMLLQSTHCLSRRSDWSLRVDAPERQMQAHSMHDSTMLPGSKGTPIMVNKFWRQRACQLQAV